MNNSRPPRKGGGFLFGLVLLNLGLLLGLWGLERFFSEKHWLPTLLANLPQHPLGLLTLVLLLWALLGRHVPAIVLGLLAVGVWLGPLMGFNIPRLEVASGSSFRVMAFNIEQAQHHSVAQIARAIRSESPDLVCLEEARDIVGFRFEQLTKVFSGWYSAHGYNVGLLSRYPLGNIRVLPMAYDGVRRKILEATVNFGQQKLTVICVHYITTSLFRQGFDKFSDKDFTSEAQVRLKTTWDLLELARKSRYPVVIGGDFNTPPRNALYYLLSSELSDTFAQAGWGFGYSWNTQWPLLRIDYLWTKELTATRAWVSQTVASDHHAVVADLIFEH